MGHVRRPPRPAAAAPVIGMLLAIVTVGPQPAWAAKGNKKKPADPTDPAAGSAAQADLPRDVNMASLRVAALLTLYELDAAPEQLRAIRTAADAPGMADTADRPPPAKASPKLTDALRELRSALLADVPDDGKVAAAHGALADAAADADVQLDDAVRPTPAARDRAKGITRLFSAGQVAAFLASHADQVVGPADRLVAGLPEVAEASPDEADRTVKQLAADVGELAAGSDEAKAAAVAAKAAEWLKANRAAAVPETRVARDRLEASAKTAVGDVGPMDVLSHWFDGQVAELLANPQTPAAAEALLAVREKEH